MFIYTVKASTVKITALSIASLLVIVALIALIPNDVISAKEQTVSVVATETDKISSGKINNADEMNAFISSLGWKTEANPSEIVDVIIPSEFNNVYLKYNEIQKQQGLNLEKYKGKTVKRYTYNITNYPDTAETVYLNLLIYKNKVIGGDVCTADVNGFIHGLKNNVSGS